MIAVLLSPFYIIVNIILGIALYKWLNVSINEYSKKYNSKVILGIYIFFSISILLGFITPRSILKRIFVVCGDYYLGVLLYTFIISLIVYLLYLLALKSKRFDNRKVKTRKVHYHLGGITLLLIIIVSLIGYISARIITKDEYSITINKESNIKSLKTVLVADLHMGYNIGVRDISNLVEKINKENPDIVFFAGDIFDNDYDAIEYPESVINILKGIKTKYGMYACLGNHDVKEPILAGFTFNFIDTIRDERMIKFFDKTGITLLEDSGTYITDNIYVYGRKDYYTKIQFDEDRVIPEDIELKESDINIILDHQPRELKKYISKTNADLVLGGHTHNGQTWPASFIRLPVYDNYHGLKKFNNTYSIVTGGIGVFGPNMRLGILPEITVINITIEK